MPGKITDLTALTAAVAVSTDLVEVLDVSDTTMAATGTNKKMTLSELGLKVGSNPYAGAMSPIPLSQVGWGLPGRLLKWTNGQGVGMTRRWMICHPFYVDKNGFKFDAFECYCDGGQAGALLDVGVFSCDALGWRAGGAQALVSGTSVINVDCSAAGEKLMVLGTPVTLPEGLYSANTLVHGTATADPTFWALTDAGAFMGVYPGLGNGGTACNYYTVFYDALPASYSIGGASGYGPWNFVCMRWHV